MLRRLAIRDFVIVAELELDLDAGFTVLTGETGAGKSILVDALQLALGGRGEAGVVREGAARAEIGAEFDVPQSLAGWLAEAGFEAAPNEDGRLLLRRTIDAQGKSRAWINGSPATIAQLREAAEHLVDIHGQHAWQSLTRAASVRDLLDAYAQLDAAPLAAAWTAWKAASGALADADERQGDLERERERLAWQVGEIERLGPGDDEWAELDGEHTRLANAQSRAALVSIAEADDSAEALAGRALDALSDVAAFDPRLESAIVALQGAQDQLHDAAHTLGGYLESIELDPARLRTLDERISAWLGLARRYRRPPAELPRLLADWKAELHALDAAADVDALRQALDRATALYQADAKQVSGARRNAAPALAKSVTQAMQQLGMTGGRFDVVLTAHESPQSFGLESAEFLVAGHVGSTPRPLAKVASGGELSRIALAIAVTTSQLVSRDRAARDRAAGTLIFDEVDAGVGGAVAETVGRLMKQLGRDRQVVAVTHLPQVAACADHHAVVSKRQHAGATRSEIAFASGEARVAEIARMLGGERLSGTSLAHAQEMLSVGATDRVDGAGPSAAASAKKRS